jgi:phosphate transport system substrate-binding protein
MHVVRTLRAHRCLACCLSICLTALVGCDKKTSSPAGSNEPKKYNVSVDPDSIKPGAMVTIDGSSSLYPVTEAVAEDFQEEMRRTISVTVGVKGTGGGMNRFCLGEIDICDASRPISVEELKRASENGVEFIELPVCFDALTVAVHPQNNWVDTITIAELKKMWEPAAEEKITKWNQIRPNWPDKELQLFGAGSDSGTFDYFTEAIVGKARSCRGDYTSSEDDNVLVQGIEGNKYALGYLPFAYFEPNQSRMKALSVDAEKGKGPVKPSLKAVLDGTYNPLSRPLFIYVNKKSAQRPEVRAFVDFYLDYGKDLATSVHYPPLPDTAYKHCKERFEKQQTGSAFDGIPAVGLPIEDILKREPKPNSTQSKTS